MDLNINSPLYYKDIYGIDDEVYRMCRNISKFMKDKKYSDIIDIIAITPVIAPEDLQVDMKWRNSINYKIKCRLIGIRRSIDFEEYANSDIDNKCKLIIKNILESVKSISRKGKFDYDKFEKDLLEFLEIEI
jgi:hypothetical protein